MKTKSKRKRRIWIPLVVLAAVILLAAALFPVVAPVVGKWFTSQETEVRDGWEVDVGDLIGVDEDQKVEIRQAPVEASITVLQLVPEEIDEEGFTYYDTDVQQRIRAALDKGRNGRTWSADAPLAVLNPFGTGSNGLYLSLRPTGPPGWNTPSMWRTRTSPTSPPRPRTARARPTPPATSSRSSAWCRVR